MSVELVRYLEPMHKDEIAFLKRKERRDRRQFYQALRIVVIICFVLPFAMAWGEAIIGKPNPFSYLMYFTGVGVLLFLAVGGALVAYRSNLYLIHRDLKQGTKTIERTTIKEKRFMPHTNTYFVYLNSPTRLSIEVSMHDFEHLREGDEINIEYATYSKAYFGYF